MLITGIGMFLRILACWQMSGLQSVQSPSQVTDMATYLRLADDILKGKFPDHFDYQPFYYTVFLPLCRFVSTSCWSTMTAQIALGALAIFLAGLTAGKLFGKKAGLMAALLLAISRMHVFYTPFALFEVLQSFWLILILWFATICWKQNKPWHWILMALILAAATLTRGNAVLLLPGILVLLIWRNWDRRLKALLLALAVIVLFELPQLPFSIRNYHFTGRWCGASTAGDKVLALGNTPEAPPGGLEYPLTYSRWVADAEKRPEEGRVSVPRHILTWASKEPFVFLELKFRSLLLFWDKQEIPNNVSLAVEGQSCVLTSTPVLLPFGILGTIALLGLLVTLRFATPTQKVLGLNAPTLLFLAYMVFTYWFGTALFYNLARFRLSAIPLLCVTGSATMIEFNHFLFTFKRLKERAEKKKLIRSYVFPIILVALVVNCVYSMYQNIIEPSFMRVARSNGVKVSFPDTTLIYDHGPLMFGGFNFIGIPSQGFAIDKTFVVDPEECKSGNYYVRIPVFLQPGSIISGHFTHGEHVISITPSNLKKERFITWLEVKVPSLNFVENTVRFTWIFPQGNNFGVGIDSFRYYSRTRYILPDGTNIPMEAEAAVEFQIMK